MNIFISGGCKNGKSYFAQREAHRLHRDLAKRMGADVLPLYYLATMEPKDEEDEARIGRHVRERLGWGFTTIEKGRNICDCLKFDRDWKFSQAENPDLSFEAGDADKRIDPQGVFLLDSVTALLSNEMFRHDGAVDLGAPQRVAGDLVEFARRTGNTVFVSDYIYSDAMPYEELTEKYREGLATVDKALASCCGQVIEVAYGTLNYFKAEGGWEYEV